MSEAEEQGRYARAVTLQGDPARWMKVVVLDIQTGEGIEKVKRCVVTLAAGEATEATITYEDGTQELVLLPGRNQETRAIPAIGPDDGLVVVVEEIDRRVWTWHLNQNGRRVSGELALARGFAESKEEAFTKAEEWAEWSRKTIEEQGGEP